MSANTVSRLKQTWEKVYEHWRKWDLSQRRYMYIWADGVYCNVLNKVPKAMQPKIKDALHDTWMAETKQAAEIALASCIKRYEAKYPGAMNCLVKDREPLLAFYDFPAEHWQHIRTSNPIESVFATVRLRTTQTKNCGNRKTTLAMAWKLMTTAQKKWRRLRGYKLLADVIEGVKFKDGEKVEADQFQDTADLAIHQI